jgi:glutaminyl-tRNA synthetase
VKGTIHWVSAEHAVPATIRMYERLLFKPDPSDFEEGEDWKSLLHPDSCSVLEGAQLEPALAELAPGDTVQFERQGYFCLDHDSESGRLVFLRTVTLRDTWAKIEKKLEG